MISAFINNKSDEEITQIKSSLPKTIQNIALCIGLPEALALVDEFGGTEIRIPHKTTSESETFYKIIGLIGKSTAQKLVECYAGDEIYIPSCVKIRRLLRNIEIIGAYDNLTKTMSSRKAINKLAFQYFISNRSVQQIVNIPQGS